MFTMRHFVLSFLALACFVDIGSSLKCHQCSSYKDALCEDPFFHEPTEEGAEPQPKTDEFLKDCPKDGKEYTLCRKIYQNVRGEERIIRSCGFEKYKNKCYKTVLEEYNTYVCECDGDGCNSSVNLKHSAIVLAIMAVVARIMN